MGYGDLENGPDSGFSKIILRKKFRDMWEESKKVADSA